MANSVKQSGEGPALQITKQARAVDLAETTSEDGAEGAKRRAYVANVRVYGFENALLIVDREKMTAQEIAKLVVSAAGDTDSIYLGASASIRPAGNGCMVSLPGLDPTGLKIGDTVPAHPGPNMLMITADTGAGMRLAEDLITLRKAQIGP